MFLEFILLMLYTNVLELTLSKLNNIKCSSFCIDSNNKYIKSL